MGIFSHTHNYHKEDTLKSEVLFSYMANLAIEFSSKTIQQINILIQQIKTIIQQIKIFNNARADSVHKWQACACEVDSKALLKKEEEEK